MYTWEIMIVASRLVDEFAEEIAIMLGMDNDHFFAPEFAYTPVYKSGTTITLEFTSNALEGMQEFLQARQASNFEKELLGTFRVMLNIMKELWEARRRMESIAYVRVHEIVDGLKCGRNTAYLDSVKDLAGAHLVFKFFESRQQFHRDEYAYENILAELTERRKGYLRIPESERKTHISPELDRGIRDIIQCLKDLVGMFPDLRALQASLQEVRRKARKQMPS